jgi:hypothetical protein
MATDVVARVNALSPDDEEKDGEAPHSEPLSSSLIPWCFHTPADRHPIVPLSSLSLHHLRC